MSRDVRLYFEDIVTAYEKIERYTAGMTFEGFEGDERTFDAVVRNLEVVGEAAKRIPDEIKEQLPELEWRKVCGLRDVLAHGYFGIDAAIVWDVVSRKVPELSRTVRAFLERGAR